MSLAHAYDSAAPEPSVDCGMHEATFRGSSPRLSAEKIRKLLPYLDADPDRAWMRYWDLWRRLAKYFECNRRSASEELADETMARVVAKLDFEEIREIDKYMFGVASFVLKEARQKDARETSVENLSGGASSLRDPRDVQSDFLDSLDQERRLDCLNRCLAGLSPDERELIVQYYGAEGEKQKTIRRKLAEKYAVTLNTLRTRCTRIRARLELCVKRCLESRKTVLPSAAGPKRSV